MNTQESAAVKISDLEVHAEEFDLQKAIEIYSEYGALVVRGLHKPYVNQIKRDIDRKIEESIAQLPQAVKDENGWSTPNQTLFLPAPENFERDKQIMVLGLYYNDSGAFMQSALDSRTLDIVEGVLGPNIELYMNGQCLVKEPVGGFPKLLHQDSAYFMHKYEGPVAVLNYAVDTTLERGALHVIPGSHRESIDHVNTFSHLGLDEKQYSWDDALPIEGEAGDSIFFHVNTIHGSKPNHTDMSRPVFIHRYRAANDFVIRSGTNTENFITKTEKNEPKALMVRGYRH